MGPKNTIIPAVIERKTVGEFTSFQGLQAMETKAVMYAPRRMLIYLGNVAARSKPRR